MSTINRVLIKFIIFLIICYTTNKISDTYISGGIAGILCMTIGEFIDELKTKRNR